MIVGGYPPPFGGVTVHVQRLHLLLSDRYDCSVLDLYSRGRAQEEPGVIRCGNNPLTATVRAGLVMQGEMPVVAHFHASAFERFHYAMPLLLAAVPRQCATVLTLHSGGAPSAFNASGRIKKRMVVHLLRRFDRLIAVGPVLADWICDFGLEVSRVTTLSSFLPPTVTYSAEVDELLRTLRQDKRRLVLLSGFAQPHYGFHIFLDALERLPARVRAAVGVVFVWYSSVDRSYAEQLQRRLKATGSHLVLRNLAPSHFAYLMSQVDVYVRPTLFDGDGVAMREAGYLEKQVVASNVAIRPKGVEEFRSEDSADLARALTLVLANPMAGRFTQDADANATSMLEIYRRLIEEKGALV